MRPHLLACQLHRLLLHQLLQALRLLGQVMGQGRHVVQPRLLPAAATSTPILLARPSLLLLLLPLLHALQLLLPPLHGVQAQGVLLAGEGRGQGEAALTLRGRVHEGHHLAALQAGLQAGGRHPVGRPPAGSLLLRVWLAWWLHAADENTRLSGRCCFCRSVGDVRCLPCAGAP